MVQYTENPIYSLPPGKNKFFNDFRLAYKLSYSKNLLVSCKTYFFLVYFLIQNLIIFTYIDLKTNSPYTMFATCLSQTLIKYSLVNTFSSKSYYVIISGKVMTSHHPGNFCWQGTTDII